MPFKSFVLGQYLSQLFIHSFIVFLLANLFCPVVVVVVVVVAGMLIM
jgi:hypothetical protein